MSISLPSEIAERKADEHRRGNSTSASTISIAAAITNGRTPAQQHVGHASLLRLDPFKTLRDLLVTMHAVELVKILVAGQLS